MIKVGFNISPLHSGHKTRGMGFYTQYLLTYLKKSPAVEIQEFSKEDELKDVDLIHYPYFDLFSLSLPLLKNRPTVVTVPDVTPLVFPKHYPAGIKGNLKNLIQRQSLQSVKGVITLSEHSKVDIEKYLGIPGYKIFPTYLSVKDGFKKITDKKLLEQTREKYKLPKVFALFVGSVNWNKNLNNIAQACLKAGIDLVLVGKDFEKEHDLDHPELASYKEFLHQYGNDSHIHRVGFVEDEDLVIIYNLADVCLLTSFYEGFGLPILEAMACGTPVVSSQISSMKEVAGEAALLIDPHSVNEIFYGIEQVTSDAKLREQLIKKGHDQVKKFSWEKCAQETIQVYEKVLGK